MEKCADPWSSEQRAPWLASAEGKAVQRLDTNGTNRTNRTDSRTIYSVPWRDRVQCKHSNQVFWLCGNEHAMNLAHFLYCLRAQVRVVLIRLVQIRVVRAQPFAVDLARPAADLITIRPRQSSRSALVPQSGGREREYPGAGPPPRAGLSLHGRPPTALDRRSGDCGPG